MLTVTNPADTRILEITVNSADPEEATVMANEYADVARNYIYEVMGTDEPSLFSVALQPTEPVSPRKTLNTVLGALVGGLVMAAIWSCALSWMTRSRLPKTSPSILAYPRWPSFRRSGRRRRLLRGPEKGRDDDP